VPGGIRAAIGGPALPAVRAWTASSAYVAYRLLMVLLAGGYGRIVLRPGQLVGQDFSLVVAGATLAVAAVFQLPAAASSGWWTGASTCAATTPADDRPMS
jgi:hypothetical protein